MFFFEFVANCMAKENYIGSFYFWLDFVATVSLIPDIGWIWNPLVGEGSSSDIGGGQLRAGRAARAGTRAGRIVRIVRLIRLVRIAKLYKEFKQALKGNEEELPSEAAEMTSPMLEFAAGRPGSGAAGDKKKDAPVSKVGAALSDLTTQRVIMLILAIIFVTPFLDTATDTATSSVDTSRQGTLQQLADMSASSAQNVTVLQFKDNVQDLVRWQGRLAYLAVCEPGTDCHQHWSVATLGDMARSTRFKVDGTGEPAGPGEESTDTHPVTSWTPDLVKSSLEQVDETLRTNEYALFAVSACNTGTGAVVPCNAIAVYDLRNATVLEAIFSIVKTLFVMVVIAVGALVFTQDAEKLVIRPIERMTRLITALAKDPLRSMDGIKSELEGEDAAATVVEVKSGTSGGEKSTALVTRVKSAVQCKSSGKKSSKQVAASYETALLENTMLRIGGLLQVGFGEAGGRIIRKNMATAGAGGELNPLLPGSKVDAIFGFCDIRNFTAATECLQEDVMTFVNRVGTIVHRSTHRLRGAANKNIGDAFLLAWRLPARARRRGRHGVHRQSSLGAGSGSSPARRSSLVGKLFTTRSSAVVPVLDESGRVSPASEANTPTRRPSNASSAGGASTTRVQNPLDVLRAMTVPGGPGQLHDVQGRFCSDWLEALDKAGMPMPDMAAMTVQASVEQPVSSHDDVVALVAQEGSDSEVPPVVCISVATQAPEEMDRPTLSTPSKWETDAMQDDSPNPSFDAPPRADAGSPRDSGNSAGMQVSKQTSRRRGSVLLFQMSPKATSNTSPGPPIATTTRPVDTAAADARSGHSTPTTQASASMRADSPDTNRPPRHAGKPRSHSLQSSKTPALPGTVLQAASSESSGHGELGRSSLPAPRGARLLEPGAATTSKGRRSAGRSELASPSVVTGNSSLEKEGGGTMSPRDVRRTAIHVMADSALAAFLKMQVDIYHANMDGVLAEYRHNPELSARFPAGFRVRMGYGLHMGWGIEGAIGSEYKIDASYLSPHVNMASRLEAATKQYGVPLLLSGSFVSDLSADARRFLRLIDRVIVKGASQPMELYTFDISFYPLEFGEAEYNQRPKELDIALRLHGTDNTHAGQCPIHVDFATDPAVQALQAGLTDEFFSMWDHAVQAYFNGQWDQAREYIQHILEEIKPEDGPCNTLLSFMDSACEDDGGAPSNWAGYRALTEK